MEGIVGATAVVTGAAQGNGAAIASGLAKQGARVALCDIQIEAAQALAARLRDAGLTAQAYELDVSDRTACARVAATVAGDLGPTEILVNNAGIVRRSAIDEPDFESDWAMTQKINAEGPTLVIRAFLQQLKDTRGRIVNLGSIMSVAAGPNLSAYAASKGAVLQLTRALAHDLAPHGIRINAIAPGIIETPMTQLTRDTPASIARFMAHTPLNRVGQPEELVGPVLFLASHLSSYVTGALLPVDGGYLAA